MKKLFITLIVLQAIMIVIICTEFVWQAFFLEHITYPAAFGMALGMFCTWAFGWSVKSRIYGSHKVYIRLGEKQFSKIVNGEIISDENSKVMLADIGFQRMKEIIIEAEKSNLN